LYIISNMSFPTFEQAIASRKLAPNSIIKYKSNVTLVKKILKHSSDTLDFINKTKTIHNALRKLSYSTSTLKSIYITLYVLADEIQKIEKSIVFKRTPLFYKEQMELYRDENNQHNNQNSIVDADNWMSMTEIKDMVTSLPTDSYDDYLNKVILALYSFLPPVRLDYDNMVVYKRTPPITTLGNYCIFTKDGFRFILNQYKTVKHFDGMFVSQFWHRGTFIYSLLQQWFSTYNTKKDYLLAFKDNSPVTKIQLGKIIYQIFDKYANKKIGIQRIRRIYETELITSPEYATLSLEEKKAKHKELLHSFNTAHQYLVLNK